MRALLYRGFDAEGRLVCGSRGFASRAQMKDCLDKRGITGYEIFESKTVYRRGVYKLVSPKELSIFCKQMSALLYSNITLMDNVTMLAEQTENKQMKLALDEVRGFMDKGYTYADSMRMYEHIFSKYLLHMLAIGETSGTLDAVFSDMSLYFEKESKTRNKLKSAVVYPAALTALMAAIILLLIIKILPMFGDILESMGAQLPPGTNAILSAGMFLFNYGPAFILVTAAVAAAAAGFAGTDAGRLRLDKAKLTAPAYRRVHIRVITARFARSLSILLKSGVQLTNAIEDSAAHIDNQYLQGKLTEAAASIRGSKTLSEALTKTGVFPPLFINMASVGEKSGRLDEMLDKAASVFDGDADDAIERFTSMLEPVLIIVLSVIVGIILLSVIFPMITVMNSVG